MKPDEPIARQNAEDSVEFIKERLEYLCQRCGKKVNYRATSISIFEDCKKHFRAVTPLDIEKIFDEIYTGTYGEVSEMKFHASTINVCMRKYLEKENIATSKQKKAEEPKNPEDYTLKVWQLLDDEPNAKYVFPALYVFKGGKVDTGHQGYTRADNIQAKAVLGEHITKCNCKDFRGYSNLAYKTLSGLWHCPFCGRKWEPELFEGIPEDVDLLDAMG